MVRALIEVMTELLGRGHSLSRVANYMQISRSTYYYNSNKPKKCTRPELWDDVRKIFERAPNGCGHRQIAMTLRAEKNVKIADKTVLKMMHEMGIKCLIRRQSKYKKYCSYRPNAGKTAENILNRNFKAARPWQKLGTDVTEFKVAGRKAYLALIVDFHSSEIVAHDISKNPNMRQQKRLLARLFENMQPQEPPILHSDMGWQYRHDYWIGKLKKKKVIQSMSRKGNCLDNAATEQVFGHLKDEFYRNQKWNSFEEFKQDLDDYIVHWNSRRRQVRLGGLTPQEFRMKTLAV